MLPAGAPDSENKSGAVAALQVKRNEGGSMQTNGKAVLQYGEGATAEFPVLGGTIGPDVVDIRTLYGKTGMFTYDPGFLSTASCRTNITYIDGD
jgi:hypothetical protein